MRAIKFIGQAISTKEWVYGNLVTREERDQTMHLISSQDASGKSWLVYPNTVGQYTGYIDSKEREIYEGDKLCLSSGDIGFVCWFTDGWVVVKSDGYGVMTLDNATLRGVELVDDREG